MFREEVGKSYGGSIKTSFIDCRNRVKLISGELRKENTFS